MQKIASHSAQGTFSKPLDITTTPAPPTRSPSCTCVNCGALATRHLIKILKVSALQYLQNHYIEDFFLRKFFEKKILKFSALLYLQMDH